MHARSLARRAFLWSCMSALAASSLWNARVRAEDASPVASFARRPGMSYEEQRLQSFLQAAGLAIDPEPDGKLIHYIRLERRQVLEPNDLLVPVVLPYFASTWTNVFHWLSEDSMVRREVLLRSGEPYRDDLAQESARNLRALSILALARVVAVKTRDPHKVGVIVYTRDLWSLRFEQSFEGAGTSFTLGGRLIERNLFGRGKWLGVSASLTPLVYTVGQTYLDPRVFQSELRASESLDVIFNRRTGETEGSTGTFRFGRPFYNLEQRTAFSLLGYYLNDVFRLANGDRVIGVPLHATPDDRTCDIGPETCIPGVWDERRVQLEAAGDYRVGERYKQTFTLGVAYQNKRFAANDETNLKSSQVDTFLTSVLPKSRRDVFPYFRYRLSLPRFATFTNLATFGRSETVQVGPTLDGKIALPLRAYGASSDGMTVFGQMTYVWAQDDALIDVGAEGEARLENRAVVDQRGVLRVRGATPSYPELWGRFVMRAYWDVHHNDTERTLVALGATEGLRGWEPVDRFYVIGGSRMLFNVEYRTRPWLLQSVHIGLLAFYDAGGVYTKLANLTLHHDVGAGLRVLLPQFNPYAFRFDASVPLGEKGYTMMMSLGGSPFVPSYGGDQVVGLTPEEDVAAAAGRRLSLVQ